MLVIWLLTFLIIIIKGSIDDRTLHIITNYAPIFAPAKSNANSPVGVNANVYWIASPTVTSDKPTEISAVNEILTPSGNVITTSCSSPASAKSRNFLYSDAS